MRRAFSVLPRAACQRQQTGSQWFTVRAEEGSNHPYSSRVQHPRHIQRYSILSTVGLLEAVKYICTCPSCRCITAFSKHSDACRVRVRSELEPVSRCSVCGRGYMSLWRDLPTYRRITRARAAKTSVESFLSRCLPMMAGPYADFTQSGIRSTQSLPVEYRGD